MRKQLKLKFETRFCSHSLTRTMYTNTLLACHSKIIPGMRIARPTYRQNGPTSSYGDRKRLLRGSCILQIPEDIKHKEVWRMDGWES